MYQCIIRAQIYICRITNLWNILVILLSFCTSIDHNFCFIKKRHHCASKQRERRSQTRRKMSFYFPSKHQEDNNKEVVFKKKKLCYFPNSEIGLHCPSCRIIFWIVCTWLTVETWWFFLFRAQQKIAQAEYNPQSSPSEHCSAWSICKFADHFWMIQITELVN